MVMLRLLLIQRTIDKEKGKAGTSATLRGNSLDGGRLILESWNGQHLRRANKCENLKLRELSKMELSKSLDLKQKYETVPLSERRNEQNPPRKKSRLQALTNPYWK